jgi:hypothetical protein
MGMIDFRGSSRAPSLLVSILALAMAVGCGGGDDGAAAPASGAGTSGAGQGGTAPGSGGTQSDAGASDTGGTRASGGTSGSGGSSGKGSGGSTTSGSGGGAAKGGGAGTTGSGGTATSALLDAIGDACKVDCDAQFALDCAPQNANTLTCQLSCAASTAELGDFCLAEYRDWVVCRGNGGYDCLQNNPYPRATCAVEQQAFSLCTQHIGCKRFCEKTLDLGCNDTAFDDCLSSCTSEKLPLPDTSSSSNSCAYTLENIALCQATSSTKCAGDALEMPAACATSVLSVAECIDENSTDHCVGWCWAADRLGCGGTDCANDCATKTADATCGSKWNALLDCVLFFGDAECDADGLVGNGICDSEMSDYKTCTAGSSK